jgi:hypothetical protein
MSNNTTGNYNTAVGLNSLFTNASGVHNTAVGRNTLYYSTGGYNAALGHGAGSSITTGTSNTTLGFEAGDNITTGSSNIIIGSGVDAPSATGGSQLNIGNWIKGVDGNIGIGVVPPTDTLSTILSVNGANIMGNSTSGSYLGNNVYYNGGWKRQFTSGTSLISHTNSGDITFRAAASGAADSAITFTTPLEIKADGRGLSQFTAKAWVNFNGTGTVAIRDSHNVSSITDDGTGVYKVNFTNAMSDVNYSAVASVNDTAKHSEPWTYLTGYVGISARITSSQNYEDGSIMACQVFGD